MCTLGNSLLQLEQRKENNMSRLRRISSSVGRYLTRHEYGRRLFIDPAFTRLRDALKAKQKELKKQGWGNKPNATTALSEEETDILFEKGSCEQVLQNHYWTLCGWKILYTLVSEVPQNNEIYVGAMLFWRLTVKAKNILFIQVLLTFIRSLRYLGALP